MKDMSLVGEIISMIFGGLFYGLFIWSATYVLPIICGKKERGGK